MLSAQCPEPFELKEEQFCLSEIQRKVKIEKQISAGHRKKNGREKGKADNS